MAVLLLYIFITFILIQYIIPLVLNTVSKVLNDLYFDLQHILENLDQWTFNQYAGLSVILNATWLALIYTVLVYNNYLIHLLDKANLKNNVAVKLSKFYNKFITIENYTLILIALIPFGSLLLVGYCVFTQQH